LQASGDITLIPSGAGAQMRVAGSSPARDCSMSAPNTHCVRGALRYLVCRPGGGLMGSWMRGTDVPNGSCLHLEDPCMDIEGVAFRLPNHLRLVPKIDLYSVFRQRLGRVRKNEGRTWRRAFSSVRTLSALAFSSIKGGLLRPSSFASMTSEVSQRRRGVPGGIALSVELHGLSWASAQAASMPPQLGCPTTTTASLDT
jgi:hypothetical protein